MKFEPRLKKNEEAQDAKGGLRHTDKNMKTHAEGQRGTERDREGQRGTERDGEGQRGTERQGPSGSSQGDQVDDVIILCNANKRSCA